jgi:hypothetical protein
MIIADIKGKLPELQNWEDYLTSCVFSSLNYLGDDCLEGFLRTARSSDSRYLNVPIRNAIYDFWPCEGNTEPDVVISTKEAVIIIEAKFYSGKSGVGVETEEEAEIQKEQKELRKQFRDQLAREYLFGKNKKNQFYVIFVTADSIFPTEDIEQTLKAIESMQGEKEAQNARKYIFWTKWHCISPIMEEVIKKDNNKTYRSLIAKDLLEFLNRRGLNVFTRN